MLRLAQGRQLLGGLVAGIDPAGARSRAKAAS